MFKIFGLSTKTHFSRREVTILWIVTFIGAAIRFTYQYDRSFIGDEVGTIIWMEKDAPYLLSHFGYWLTMNYFIVFEKFISILFGNGVFSLGFVPLAAGIATIPLTANLAKRYTTTNVAIMSSVLVAANPYLIRYSGIIRSYSLLMALSILAIILFSNYLIDPSLKNGILVSAGCYLMTLFHPNGSYTIAYILIVSAITVARNFSNRFLVNTIKTYIIPLSISMLCICFSYIAIFPEMFKDGARWHDIPPTSIAYIPYLFEVYFSTSVFRWISVSLMLTGIFSAIHSRKALWLLSLYLIVPIVCMSAQGLSHYPWAYARFLIPCVPAILIFLCEGLCFCSEKYFSSRYRSIAAIFMIAMIMATWMPNAKKAFGEKVPIEESRWYKAAKLIAPKYQEGDIILCEGFFMQLNLQTYLSKSKYRILTLQEYINNVGINHHAGEVFLITSNKFKTSQSSESLGNSKVVRYPLNSKDEFLAILNNDYIRTAEGLPNSSDLEINISEHLCSIHKYLKLESDSYCKLAEQYKVDKEEFRMTSIWDSK